MKRGERRSARLWQIAVVAMVGLLLVVQLAATLNGDLDGLGGQLMSWTYFLLLGIAIAITVARVVLVEEARTAWTLFALGLFFWTAGDLYYQLFLSGDPEIPYPSPADGLYMLLYGFFIAGLWKMGGRVEGAGRFSVGLTVCLFGLATLWSWLVYGVVIGSAAGSTAAIVTTLSFPFFDLVLIGSSLVAVAARGWRLDRAFAALIFGFTVLAVVDLIYAAQVASGTYVDGSLLDVGWVWGALAIAVASWLPASRPERSVSESRLLPAVAATLGAGVALAVMVVDHFDRVDFATIVLAGATLALAVIYLLVLFRMATLAHQEAEASEELRSASIEAALDCILTVDAGGVIHEWNHAAETTFGYTREEAIGSDFADLIAPPEMRERHREGVAGLAGVADSPLLGRLLRTMGMNSRGEVFPVEMSVARLRGEPEMFTAFLRDITERRRREEENLRLAEIVRSSRDAYVSIDLDGGVTAWNEGAELLYGFTAEEAIGRRVSDLVIPPDRMQEVASIIDRVVREGSAALVSPRHTKSGEILDVSSRAFPIKDVGGDLTGISLTCHDVTESRREQRERARRAEQDTWRARVTEALAEGGFEFFGQPVVDAASGALHHHELLIRMRRDGEIVPPDRFLPHAESSGLIVEIDRWAIRAGIAAASRSPVAINLSARSLSTPGLSDLVAEALASSGAAPADVRFELTETAASDNIAAAQALIEQLGQLGCGVAIDDFGTGYGTFSYLKFLPVDELKIDTSFTRDLGKRDINRRVVQSIVTVARNFNMRTVAEGVEDEPTARLLTEMGVDLLQGYHFGRPRPLREIEVFSPVTR